MLDARLESLYVRRLQCFKDDLLSNTGPIGTFAARIQIARALAWINSDVQHDLDAIRSIRNEFAHSFDHDLSFASQSIANKCRTLRTAQALIEGHEIAAARPHKNLSSNLIRAMGSIFLPPRSRYEITVEFISQHLDEIAGEDKDYGGPDLLEEAKQLGSNINIRISATGTVGPAPPEGA
jgi:hypothetical protein